MKNRYFHIAALLGMALAFKGIVVSEEKKLTSDSIAFVNSSTIPKAKLDQALNLVREDLGHKNPNLDQKAVLKRLLNRLIDEQILIEKGLEINIVKNDPELRSLLVRKTIEWAIKNHESPLGEPTEKQLKRFYQKNLYLFRKDLKVLVRKEGDSIGIPSIPMNKAKLTDYVGPEIASSIFSASVGDTIGEIKLLKIIRDDTADFKKVKKQVIHAYRRFQDDQIIRNFLDRERQRMLVTKGQL